MSRTFFTSTLTIALAGIFVLAIDARTACAQGLIANGGFESGLTGWTRADQVGSDGTFFLQSGMTSPVNTSIPVPAPPGGISAAMSDSQGPGSHVLYQDFTVPTIPLISAQLQFDYFVGNRANAFFSPNPVSLDFSTTALNQQARVDLLTGTADPFSGSATDILFNVYKTAPGDPLISGYNSASADLTAVLNANLGNTLRLRIAEVDNVFFFQFGVDNITLKTVPIPEPASISLIGLLAIYCLRKKSDT